MKKIIPFKKEILFKTHLAEVTSISLEHSLHMEEENLITGEFLISGEYKISDTSTNTEIFNYNLPFDIHMDEHYDLSNATVDIYDFYYEIINNNILGVNIEVNVNHFKEKPLLQEIQREVLNLEEELVREEQSIEEEEKSMEEKEEIRKETVVEEENRSESSIEVSSTSSSEEMEVEAVSKINSIFPDAVSNNETYTTYKIYIVRENDSLEMILEKYGVTRESLEQYNDLKELKIGDKLIIPNFEYAQN